MLPYSTRLDRFFLLCFYTAWILFLFNVVTYVLYDRIAKFKAEAAKRRKVAAPPVLTATEPASTSAITLAPADKGTTAVAVAPAAVATKKAMSTFGVCECSRYDRLARLPSHVSCPVAVFESPPDRYDMILVICLECAFAIGVAIVLSAPN